MPVLILKKENLPVVEKVESVAGSEEVMVFCPQCKAFQTVWMDGNRLVPTRKFIQVGSEIYHDCGSPRPCRLYRGW